VVASFARAAVELLFPSHCLGCGRGGAFLCDDCASQLTPALPPRCPRCWEPRSVAGECLACQDSPPAFDALRTAFVYQGLAREMVQALKYRGVTALAGRMGGLLAEAARSQRLEADVIVPVPLSGMRKRTRGYNQAEALAVALGRELGLPVAPKALVRRRHTPPQARRADAEARRANVAGAFVVAATSIAGQSVLLIDDVATTGATLSACASALREAGSGPIWALTFARED
jgi:competence protein ComFC